MLEKVEGIILNVTPYGETSKIINVFTKEYGIIGIMAKGAFSIKSKYRSTTEKLTYGSFNIYYKKDKLSTLSSVDVINPLKKIRSDILLISYASYICDLVSQVLKQSSDKCIYDDFINSLLKIEEGINPVVITNILEVKLLDYLGVGLNLTSCINCGNKKDIVTLSSEKGGLICKNCYNGESIIPISYVKVLNMYYLVDIKSISKLSLKDDVINEINKFINSYYDDYTGLYLKSKDFLKKAEKL
jgi:DNA repair protein RecO (recombination protein O)